MDIKVSVFVPKEILSQAIVQDAIAQVMVKKTAPEGKTLFKKTVFGWAHKPSFRQALTRRANYISMRIWAQGGDTNRYGLSATDQYQMVNFGTKPHPITIRQFGRLLTFNWAGPGSYKASTSPGRIQSNRHYKVGPLVQKFAVDHPGIKEPRRFDLAIKKQYEPTFRKDMQDAISVAAAKTVQSNN